MSDTIFGQFELVMSRLIVIIQKQPLPKIVPRSRRLQTRKPRESKSGALLTNSLGDGGR